MNILIQRLLLCSLLFSSYSLQAETDTGYSSALLQLLKHIDGREALTADVINQHTKTLQADANVLGASQEILKQAFAVVDAYEASEAGPLFINAKTRKGFPRKPRGGLEIDRALFTLQQAIMDYAYSPENVQAHYLQLNGRHFKTSAYFPGSVGEAPDPTILHTVQINASHPKDWGSPVMFAKDPARRPTGCYLAPGTIARITVPDTLLNAGYSIRVGAHSWDLKKKPTIKRLDRVSLVFPIHSKQTLIANPLGGGIYIEVPSEADAGLIDITIQNAVRAPYYSARSFDQTKAEEWKIERAHPGPWTDFESDKFMMQVPTSWIYKFNKPKQLMEDWNRALDAVSTLMGLPLVRGKTVLYLQVDVALRGNANFPGYPQSNNPYNPHKSENGNKSHWLLQGPQHGGAIIFHELGHAQLFTKFKGEVEAVVNLPFVAVLNKGFGIDLDTAFGKSFNKETVSLDQAAIMWMVTENFRTGKPMDISNSPKNEVRYQHRGYGKYVEIANLFGWEVLEKFWHSVHVDYMNGITYNRNSDPTDNRILRLSKAAQVDLTPLIHFWGIPPENPAELKQAIQKAGLQPSPAIYNQLIHYKSIIPMDAKAFADHARIVYPKGLQAKNSNPNFGVGWYQSWLPKYQRSHGEAAQKALQTILDTYFPSEQMTTL